MAIDKSDYKRIFATVFTHAEELLLNAKQHTGTLNQYLQSWVSCAEKAVEVGNPALQDLILLFIDASGPAFKNTKEADNLTDGQWQLLKKWDNLFASYINAPDDQQNALALIKCLNDPLLAMGLEPEDEQMLLDGFLPIIKQLMANNGSVPIKYDEANAEQISIWKKLGLLFKETDANLQEMLTQQISDKAYGESLKHYLESWRIIAEAIETTNDPVASKILDVLLLFIEFSCELFNQIDNLDDGQRSLFKQWHNLFGHYIKTGGSQQLAVALLKNLSSPVWPQPLLKGDEKMLLAELGGIETLGVPVSSHSSAPALPVAVHSPGLPVPVEAADVSSVTIWQGLNKPINDAVLNLKVMIAELEQQGQPVFAEAVQAYQQNWQKIAEIIENDGQQAALLDVVLLFIEITGTAFEQESISNQHLARLKKWHGLFGNYIKERGNQQFVLPLIKCLRDSFWPAAITDEDEKMLMASFKELKSSLASSRSLAPSNPVVLQTPLAIRTAPEIIATPPTESLPEPLEDSSAATPITPPEIEVKTSTPALSTEKITIWQKLESLFDKTSANLTTAVEDQLLADEPALKLSLQRYLESWLAVAQQIEIEAQPLALLDVVLLFIEVSRQAFEQLKNFDEKQVILLNKWQRLFSSYLKAQGNQQLAGALIKCLGDPVWPGAIMPEDEAMLLAGFTAVADLQAEELPLESISESSNDVFPSVEETSVTEQPQLSSSHELEAATELLSEQHSLSVVVKSPEFTLPEEEKPETDAISPELLDSSEAAFEIVLAEETEAAIDLVCEDQASTAIANQVETTAEQNKTASIWVKLEPIVNQATAVLKAAVDDEIINDTAAFKQGLEHYVQSWQTIADIIATDDNLFGVFDVVLLFTETIKQVFAQIDSLGSEQFALLTNWHTSFVGYFNEQDNAPSGFRLVKCLSSPLWPAPIEADDELMLLEELGIDAEQIALQIENEQQQPVNATVAAEKNPIWQNIEMFFDDAQSQLQEMQKLLVANHSPACREYLQQYVERWLVIAEIMAEEDVNLQTLADLTLLFADNCMELVEQNVALTLETTELFLLWHTAFTAYLQDVTASGASKRLCECLENSQWLQPLTSVDEGMLLEMLADESQQSIAANNSEDILMFGDDLSLENDNDEFGLFAEEESEQITLMADESLEQEVGEDFTLLAEQELEEPMFLMTAEPESEQESEEPALFADDAWQASVSEDVTLPVQEAENNVPELPTAADEAEIPVENSLEVNTEDPVNFTESSTTAVEAAEEVAVKQIAPVNPELINMVRDEFSLLVNELNTEIKAATDAQAFKEVLKNHEFKFENLAKACNTIGLLGLEQVFVQLSSNMRSRRDVDSFSETEADLFKAVLPLIQNYIAAITEIDKSIALVAHLSMPGWKQPLTETQTKSLLTLLSGLVLGSHSQQLGNRKTTAEPADVSLELPEEVNRELLDSLLNELPVLTGNFSAVIQQIISGSGNVAQLLEAQRIAHTLKGSGNIVGVAGIAVVTHHLEEILEYLTEHKTFPTKALAAVLLESADCLEMMCDQMLNDEREPPDQALQVLQNVLDWANQIAANGLPAEDSNIETTTIPAQPDTDVTPVVQEAKATEAVAMTRVPSEVIDELLRMTGEGSILSEQFKERIKRFSAELKTLNELTWQMQSLVSELDQSINIQSYSAKAGRAGLDTGFDALEMEQYNELHTAASRISEVATDIREINIHMDEQLVDLKYLMIEEDTIQKENQEIVQSIRMVPASTIASRCQRIVRQACRATNKEVDLEIKGADILIDSEILNDMVEPLMHLLRNSIDHGIEPLHIREKFNKPKTGKITLEFSRKGNYAVISCKDDGGGLASGNILQTAIKKGLISAKQQLTDAEIHKLILIPGFSTRAVATQTSGRGIGMDAIQTKISTIQGQMNLHSVRGEGLTIEITIPLTLSSMLSLLVKCGGQTMAISNRGLRKIHHSDECIVVQENGQLYCDIDYKRYPAKYFAELVGIPMAYSLEQKLQAVRIEDEIGRTHVVFVDELLGYRDLLVKNMGGYIPHIQGITGASILGNGDVAPVIDLVEMLHHAAKYDYVLADASKALADSINGLPVALVVDDSLSARRAVAMLLKDSGLEVETAIDGLDAIKRLDKAIPDIIVVDLEMPRMNGIELTAHVRGREAMKDTPIIMITSRATEKHRKQAEAAGVTKFMTKPFTEDDLINSVRMLMK